MTTVVITQSSREQAQAELEDALERLGMSVEEASERAKSYSLSEDQEIWWRRVRALRWLTETE